MIILRNNGEKYNRVIDQSMSIYAQSLPLVVLKVRHKQIVQSEKSNAKDINKQQNITNHSQKLCTKL